MAVKKFIDKILDMPKLIRRLWLLLWILLVILLVMKFCFGIWYPVVSNNEVFINVCEFIDNNRIVLIIITGILYIFNGHLIYLTCTSNRKYKRWYFALILTIVLVIMFPIKYFNNSLGLVLEVLYIIFTIIYNIRNKVFGKKIIDILFPIVYYILINLWEFTILITRGTSSLVLTDLPSLVILILQLDYYIFLTITWIGVSFMGFAGFGWFWSKDITVLKAEREKELKKVKPNMKKVESLDTKIAELEKEGK